MERDYLHPDSMIIACGFQVSHTCIILVVDVPTNSVLILNSDY